MKEGWNTWNTQLGCGLEWPCAQNDKDLVVEGCWLVMKYYGFLTAPKEDPNITFLVKKNVKSSVRKTHPGASYLAAYLVGTFIRSIIILS